MADFDFPLTHSDALQRLDDFLPHAGAAYARLRNKEQGQGEHVHVSRLSAALRRRLISEQEVVDAVLARHGLAVAEKFVSEVFWRTYWKGWLEQRPTVWEDYGAAVERALEQLDAVSGLRKRHASAIDGSTGIDCFDAWTKELNETGYLHNWARMQFASIWIFTLGLPWELGAASMFDRLIDADPASNTLSWRWVAGLHTAGKAYLADAERIRSMTDGRFSPAGLARTALIPADSVRTPSPSPIRLASSPDPSAATLLLLTTEDLSVEQVGAMRALPVKSIVYLKGRSSWDETALADALARTAQVWPDAEVCGALAPGELPSAAKSSGCTQVATAFLPVGPVASSIAPVRGEFDRLGIAFTEYLREWDRMAWPHSRKGFFGLKEKIPALLQAGHR